MPDALRERLLGEGRTLHVQPGQMPIMIGSESAEVYLVLSGRLRLILCSSSGREVIIRDFVAGDLFGELPALDGEPRSATVVTIEKGAILRIPSEVFLKAIETIPGGWAWLAKRLVRQVRELTNRIFELGTLPVNDRIHCELLRLAASGAQNDGTVTLNPAPTHAEIACRIGSHREAVTREFRYLADAGILRQERRTLRILDVTELARRVSHETGRDRGTRPGGDLG